MSTSYLRPNFVEIDLAAIRRCTRAIRDAIGPSVKFFGTLKANGYGFGLVPVAKTVLGAGADAISLISLADAIALREAGITSPILLYAGVTYDRESVRAIERYRITPTLHDEASLDALLANVEDQLDCAIKIDAGNERIGVASDIAGDYIARVARSGKLRVAIVNTHPSISGAARADECLQWQYERFERACRDAEAKGVRIPLRVMASSKVLGMTRAMNLDGVDPGQALFTALPGTAAVQPLAKLRTPLLEVKPVNRSDFLEQAPFGGRAPKRLGVVPIGYSDGIHRLNAGAVLVGGRRAPLLGSPAIEYTRIDLTDVPDAKAGDEAVFIGAQGGERITPEDVIAHTKAGRLTDLACELRPGIQRIYLNP
ncbi:MAG: Alanine racemase [Betaproteobacteria bacterium]|nr:Alanine racemase [Betaproteobacteria bacterium]